MLQTWRRTLFQRRPPTLQEPALCRPLAATQVRQVRNLKPFLPIHGSASSASTLPQAAKAAKTSTTETTGSVNIVQKASQEKGTFVDPPQETTSSGAVGAVYERDFEKK